MKKYTHNCNQYKHIILTAMFLLLMFLSACTSIPKNGGKTEFIDLYFEDAKGNKITQADSNDEYVYLVLISKNGIGKKATLSLDEHDDGMEFIYKGTYLVQGNDITFTIRKNKQKLKLYYYNPKNKRHRRIKEKAVKKGLIKETVPQESHGLDKDGETITEPECWEDCEAIVKENMQIDNDNIEACKVDAETERAKIPKDELDKMADACATQHIETEKDAPNTAEKKEIIDMYFEDKNGNRCENIPSFEEYFYMVIISKNYRGTELALRLKGADDFIFNGQYISNNRDIPFHIEQNQQRFKIYRYNPQNKEHRRLKEKAMLQIVTIPISKS